MSDPHPDSASSANGGSPPSVPAPDRGKSPHPAARTPEEWRQVLREQGEAGFRADQVFRWIHRDGVLDPAQMTNLSHALRQRLEADGLHPPLTTERVVRSADGTRKALMSLDDGRLLECVLIPRWADGDLSQWLDDEDEDAESADSASDDRSPTRPVTLCVSTQVGCAMGCVFCASGQAGLKRGLRAQEIVAQVLLAKQHLDTTERLRNLVFMGMGEPLHHYAETARAIRLLTHPAGQGMSPRRITVSTVGLVPGIRKLGEDFAGKVGLAISLHAPNTELRSRIIPMNERYPLSELLAALRAYPLPKRRRITIEYTLIAGLNDQPEHARQLAEVLRGLPSKVNLIPMNPIEASDFRRPSAETVERFRSILGQQRVSCSVRSTRGDDVDAACGQLALSEAKPDRRHLPVSR